MVSGSYFRRAGLAVVIISSFASTMGPLYAQSRLVIPVPRIKPEAPNNSQFLSNADSKHFRLGMLAADRRSWDEVKRLENQLSETTAKSILAWRRATDDSAVSFKELSKIVQYQSDWPRMTLIRSKAEKLLLDEEPLSARDTVVWFGGEAPVSGEGRAALARAHYKLGNTQSGDEWLKLAWRESKLTRTRQRSIMSSYKSRLTQDDHAARADYLIWLGRSHYSSAEALLPFMKVEARKLITARIRVGANRSGMDASLKALSDTQAKDTGVLYERGYWRRKRKSKDYALPVYQEISAPATTEPGRNRLWYEKKLLAYWLMEDKKYREAYNITLHHGFERGAKFAEAEFLAGWISLTYMNDPKRALTHFTRLYEGVSLPVSKSRAAYWQGRAAEANRDPAASAHYSNAAKFVNAYYGQLASAHINGDFAQLTLPPEADPDALAAKFEGREVVRALRLIGEVKNSRVFRQFSFHLDDEQSTPEELTLLAKLAKDYAFNSASVRAAKQGGRLGVVLTQTSYPVVDTITNLGREFDIPFVLAIARQESEFNATAVSHAKAYGLMQMIDATARYTARKHKLKYSKTWLTIDQDYAAKLGAYHLHDLLDKYDGSYIMAAAAYNAGASRVNRWNKTYGDPRKGEIDPIDWVESIPYSETRNYVQRVLENISVYRARLANNQAPLEIDKDLRQGAFR